MPKIPEFIKVDIETCTLPECEEHLLYLRYLLRREANPDKQTFYHNYIAKVEDRLKALQAGNVLLN